MAMRCSPGDGMAQKKFDINCCWWGPVSGSVFV